MKCKICHGKGTTEYPMYKRCRPDEEGAYKITDDFHLKLDYIKQVPCLACDGSGKGE